MPLFLTDEEFFRCSNDVSVVVDKADSYIKDLYRQIETLKAQADASSITAEQTCSLLEQKYVSLTSDFAKLEGEKEQLAVTLEQHISDVAELQSQKHQLHLKSIGRDGDVERLSIEVSELHKSNRQLLELIEQRDAEITEKNSTLKIYLEKIVNLTDNGSQREARIHDIEAEIARSNAAVARLSQEKELTERHSVWLNDELTAMVNSLNELRRSHNEHDSQISSKLANVQREYDECSRSLKWNEERVRVLEMSLTSMQEELCSCKDAAAVNEERYSAEMSTVTKLVELYKESSEEWSTKAGELEGVIRALETHLDQVENGYKEKLEKEVATRNEIEKEANNLKDKLEKCEAEIESNRKSGELSLVPFSSYGDERLICGMEDERSGDNSMIVPKIPAGISGTALAASLLRDGWSLAKMYEKYQEASDALQHERLGRKQSQAVLEKVLFEIEEKAEIILDERAEHERMVEAYSKMNQKLQQSLSEQVNIEGTIRNLKADLRRQEREYNTAQKEIADLQKQVTVLLKECRDIQLRCGSTSHMDPDDYVTSTSMEMTFDSDVEKVISERLLTFKDITGLVEQNVQLRSLVRNLSDQNDTRDAELKERFEMELRKQADDAASKVTTVLKRVEEQGNMIESLHNSVALYKRLYEEEQKRHDTQPHSAGAVLAEHGRKDLMLLFEGSQEASKKAHEQALQRARHLEVEMAKSRSEIISIGLERDKLAMEVNFARDRLDNFMKEFDHQRDETISVKARNIEFSQLIVEYQRKLRDSSDSVNASEELSRKLTMDVSILKHEKEMLLNSEKRASEEVLRLSERVHRLQASLDTIQSAEEVREEARSMERRRQEEQLNRAEREWAEAKRELQDERDNVRSLTLDREQTIKHAMRQVEEIGKQLADALHAVAAAEARAAVAEARCSNLEASLKSTQNKELEMDRSSDPSNSSTSEEPVDLLKAKQEMGRLKEEAQVNKEHMLQYKSIAQVNEAALKQIESAHEKFKAETEKLKKSLEAEIVSLRERVSELENDCVSKSKEVVNAVTGKEEALDAALAEISNLKEDISLKTSKMMAMELQLSSLKEDLGKENERWRNAQNNYERQVILQSDTIQELTTTSQALGSLQLEASDLRKLADARKNEIDILRATWETEKAVLEQLKNESEKNYAEINEQNKILHNHLEALHIKVAEKERSCFGGSSGSTDSAQHGDLDLQSVVHYLRRSKEIAETEISLLKQENLRLRSQLESALKASETAQSLLQLERANSRSLIFSDEEFKSLQIQVREINLLRESNIQLREENKNNFEECQKLREITRKARIEAEHLETLLREKQITVESNQKEIEMQKIEKANLEKRLLELLEKGKNIDLEEYERAKDGFQKIQVKLREKEAELVESKRLVAEKQDIIARLEHDLANSRSELNEKEMRTNDSLQIEAKLRMELDKLKLEHDKLRRLLTIHKKRNEGWTKEKEELIKEKQSLSKQLEDSKQGKRPIDALAKEKEELINENQSLLKQLEDSKQGKRPVMDSANDQAMIEKEMKIQILMSTLDKEREEVRKEKIKRVRTEKAVESLVKNVAQERKKLVDELEKYKKAKEQLQESTTVSASQLPLENVLDDHMASYQAAVKNLEVGVDSLINEAPAVDVPPVTTSPAGRQVHPQAMSAPTGAETAGVPSQTRPVDDREKRPISKPNVESRKGGRRLVRPRLARPVGACGDVEMSEVEASSNNADSKVVTPSHDSEPEANLAPTIAIHTLVRKRPASLASSGTPDEGNIKEEPGSSMPKKSKVFDCLNENIAEIEERVDTKTDDAVDTACEEPVDSEKDDIVPAAGEETIDSKRDYGDATIEQSAPEEVKDSLLEGESQNEINPLSEELMDDKVQDTEEDIEESMRDGEEQDPQQQPFAAEVENDREEGELPSNLADPQNDGGFDMIFEAEESLAESVIAPGVEDEEAVPTTEVVPEAVSPEILLYEKNEMGELMEETAEDNDKSNSGNEEEGAVDDIEHSPKGSFGAGGVETSSSSPTVNLGDPKQGNTNVSPKAEGGKEDLPGGSVSPKPEGGKEDLPGVSGNSSARIINMNERARSGAVLRQAGVVRQAGAASSPVTRGRGRAVLSAGRTLSTVRGRGVRARGRGGRGNVQAQEDKEQS
ncbi:nuclear-pore anchor-like isoform X3 [Papaver somniferum]|uniref:nuclear-pore anchor-like isoform X3 n=1 Tax=Papaver somniferum TaxID=3469 RepID=UPI000E6F4AE9|nr:nuclear-pore anchor-like isoform X3 [Papaver somniferum]